MALTSTLTVPSPLILNQTLTLTLTLLQAVYFVFYEMAPRVEPMSCDEAPKLQG